MPDKNQKPIIETKIIDVVDTDSEDYKTLQRLKFLCAKEWNHYEKEFVRETKKIHNEFLAYIKKTHKVDVRKGERLIVADRQHHDKNVPLPKNDKEMIRAINLYYLESTNVDSLNRLFREFMSRSVSVKHPSYEALYFKRKIFYDLNRVVTDEKHKTPQSTLKAMEAHINDLSIEASTKRNRAFSKVLSGVLISIAKVLGTKVGERADLFFKSHTVKKVAVMQGEIDKLKHPNPPKVK